MLQTELVAVDFVYVVRVHIGPIKESIRVVKVKSFVVPLRAVGMGVEQSLQQVRAEALYVVVYVTTKDVCVKLEDDCTSALI